MEHIDKWLSVLEKDTIAFLNHPEQFDALEYLAYGSHEQLDSVSRKEEDCLSSDEIKFSRILADIYIKFKMLDPYRQTVVENIIARISEFEYISKYIRSEMQKMLICLERTRRFSIDIKLWNHDPLTAMHIN